MLLNRHSSQTKPTEYFRNEVICLNSRNPVNIDDDCTCNINYNMINRNKNNIYDKLFQVLGNYGAQNIELKGVGRWL